MRAWKICYVRSHFGNQALSRLLCAFAMHADTKGGAARTTRVRSVLTTAVLLWQIAEGAAVPAMVPWVVNVSKEKNTMMMTMIAIFAAGLLVGNLLQCAMRLATPTISSGGAAAPRLWSAAVAMPATSWTRCGHAGRGDSDCTSARSGFAEGHGARGDDARSRGRAEGAEVPGTTLMCPACGNSMGTQWPACESHQKLDERRPRRCRSDPVLGL